MKWFVYIHKRGENGDVFYVGVGKVKNTKYFKTNRYRAFTSSELQRNEYWNKIFIENNKKFFVEIIAEFDNVEDAYSLERMLIKKHGKIYNGTGVLANKQDGGFVSDWGQAVLLYDREGLFVKKYDSVNELAKEQRCSTDSIYSCISRQTGLKKKYQVRYFEKDYPLTINSYEPCRVVFQYKLNGEFLKKWRSADDAASELKIDRSGIRRNCYGTATQSGGFVWSFKEIEFNEKVYKIAQCDLEGNIIHVFDNATKAQKSIGIFSASILLCCKGKMKRTKNYTWKFIEVK